MHAFFVIKLAPDLMPTHGSHDTGRFKSLESSGYLFYNFIISIAQGSQDGLAVCTLTYKLSSLGLNRDPAINHHPGVSQAGRFISACAVPRIDIKLGVPSAAIR